MLSCILTRLARDHCLVLPSVGYRCFRPITGLHLAPPNDRVSHKRSFFKLPEPLEPFARKKYFSQHRQLGYSCQKWRCRHVSADHLASVGFMELDFKLNSLLSLENWSLRYPIEKMFQIAADVDRYKEFVPWCIGSKVVRKVDERCNEVQLTVGFPPIVESYLSTVTLVNPYLVKSVSSETRLFKQLISLWQFYVGETDPPNTCHLSFSVMYEFQSPLHAAIASLFFNEVTRKMIVAFTERARKLHGPPSIAS